MSGPASAKQEGGKEWNVKVTPMVFIFFLVSYLMMTLQT